MPSDTKEYERGLNSAKGMATSTSQDITKSVGNLKKGALVATGAIAAGLTAFGMSSVKAGMEFDTSMSQVAATMGKTNAELQQEVGDYCIVEEYIQGVTLDQYFAAPNVGVKEKYSSCHL